VDETTAFKTKRDARREQRLADLNRVRAERQRALRKKKQRAMLIYYGRIAAVVLAFILVAVLIYLLIHHATAPTRPHANAVYGQSIACVSWDSIWISVISKSF
jgi:large-conductance mechanosensitive channel